ncbi:hypothetical protein HETIRDRAFT_453055 [Heterobasidion irregulare TC 32-1]|uniref:BRCT domain-containing protein n=1 Tax=Heterobasidion irregulare (strain TC 32-1) TaxID=747525 RepID=W4K4S6_HETIT|nr:uncharacterized protein HETIRDRAFT_453055 [Heterobasidion irregulare TC 32-1]ETW80061.1 hypothetical protein HETIRDRAFT_453055 [Heterobasidion irregulare TC 32-1]
MQPFPYPYSYSELDERVNAPDEDWDAYTRRLRSISPLNALGTGSNKAHTPSGGVFVPIDSGPSVPPTLPRPSPVPTTTKKRGISTIQRPAARNTDEKSKRRRLINSTDPVAYNSSNAKQGGPAQVSPIPDVGSKVSRASEMNLTASPKPTLLKSHHPAPPRATKAAHDDVAKQTPHTTDNKYTLMAHPAPPAKPLRAKSPIVPADTSVITTPGRSPATTRPAPPPPVRAATVAALQMQPLRSEIQKASSSARRHTSANSKAQKHQPQKYTPSEYARALVQRVLDPPPPPTPPEAPPARKTVEKQAPRILKVQTVKRGAQQPQHLKGHNIFYTNGDMHYATETTRKKMDYVRARPIIMTSDVPTLSSSPQIVKLGGTLVPEFDPAVVTHIVTDAGAGPTARALGLRSLSDIPQEIPTLTWKWVNFRTAEKDASGNLVHNTGPEFLFAAFQERVGAGRGWARKASVGSAGIEHATKEGNGNDPAPREEAGEQTWRLGHVHSDFTKASIEIDD